MFRIGIGPSSSHTVGPMRAAHTFAQRLKENLPTTAQHTRLSISLFGSLGATGRGHATDRAVMLGLAGYEPHNVPQTAVSSIEHAVELAGVLCLNTATHHGAPCAPDCPTIEFNQQTDIAFTPRTVLPGHPNALTLTATHAKQHILNATFYSVGGGFVVEEISTPTHLKTGTQTPQDSTLTVRVTPTPHIPYPFNTAEDMIHQAREHGLSISEMMRRNEQTTHTRDDISHNLALIWDAMNASINSGLTGHGHLPGGLRVPRRAPALHRKLRTENSAQDPLRAMDWINLYALAVNEENAAGHRVVTAPTNGAAGIIPAVIKYFITFVAPGEDHSEDIENFLLTAAAIGVLIKKNASIAGAEVGCQGEVGSACAMAAAGLAEVLGGTPEQIENAAEIAMEHNLGLTCDPIGGLVQVPCIERNAIGAVKAINAARMALRGDGEHTVSLDVVIETMRQTGLDMNAKYKETSTGGLAVNIVEC
ncbi:L-serine ammonia-lyase [Timonella sp. A28]|uniref:L-serine ammonia-lyase n=1 Tax=Timonella sp. A28 TaxID=3442640 RepID=UPI003EBFC2FB